MLRIGKIVTFTKHRPFNRSVRAMITEGRKHDVLGDEE